MTLIEYINTFQAVSEARRFSANARSLYLAILCEFNKLRYPVEVKLQNTDLQHLSGIKSTSSFDAARTALINAGLIKHSKKVYRLLEVENIPKKYRKFSERKSKIFDVDKLGEKKEERERERDALVRAGGEEDGWLHERATFLDS